MMEEEDGQRRMLTSQWTGGKAKGEGAGYQRPFKFTFLQLDPTTP